MLTEQSILFLSYSYFMIFKNLIHNELKRKCDQICRETGVPVVFAIFHINTLQAKFPEMRFGKNIGIPKTNTELIGIKS
jgi:hypothetical protein